MSKGHKDLPAGSQPWAQEVDADRQLLRVLLPVVKRLAENAGLDFSNPQRGINAGTTPSIKNPVGQKLSSLADVQTYNVLDEQVLSWNQQGQRWLPVTLPSPTAGGTIDISDISYTQLTEGYGTIISPTEWAYTAAGAGYLGNAYVETWSTNTSHFGAGNKDTGPVSMIEMSTDGLGRPYVQIRAEDYTNGLVAWVVVTAHEFRVHNAKFVIHHCTTAERPTGLNASDDRGSSVYDLDLEIPIWWNGTTWTNALGTAV